MGSRKRWRAFAACSLKGNSPSGGQESDAARKAYLRRFPVAVVLPAPVWEIRLDEIKFTDNTLGFGKNCTGYVTHAPSRRSASRLNAGRSSGVRLVTS